MIQDGSADSGPGTARRADHLIGAMLVDTLSDGFSAVYSFFDPAAKRRSLGTFIVLAAIEMLKMRKHPFLYLDIGSRNRQDGYKRGSALQMLGPAGWVSAEQPHRNCQPARLINLAESSGRRGEIIRREGTRAAGMHFGERR